MIDPNLTILYVADTPASERFYADLLGKRPVESSPAFAMFALDAGHRIGLWARHTVAPAPVRGAMGGSVEIVFAVGSDSEVDATHDDWSRRGLSIAQQPTRMEFGRTFVALDPDGHRLRVYHHSDS
jgi:catechol 2,3-dioxygenase-like lactoylglutathione lyase family enzyme